MGTLTAKTSVAVVHTKLGGIQLGRRLGLGAAVTNSLNDETQLAGFLAHSMFLWGGHQFIFALRHSMKRFAQGEAAITLVGSMAASSLKECAPFP